MIQAAGALLLGLLPLPERDLVAVHGEPLHRIGLEQGLSDTHLRAIVQDRDGFLWFGTVDGLNRYDGYQVRIFAHDPGDPRSLGSNYVQALDLDRSGNLWVGTLGGGLNLYDSETEDFVRFQHQPGDPGTLAANEVFSLCDDGRGSLWIATSRGLDRLELSSRRIEHFRHDAGDPESLAHDSVYSVIPARGGALWVGTRAGLDRLDRSEGRSRFTHFQHDPENPKSLSHDFINVLREGADGSIWVGTWGGGLDKLDPESGAVIRYRDRGLLGAFIWSILEDRDGNVWVGSANAGLSRIESGSVRVFRHDAEGPSTVGHDNVIALYEDREGLLWVGTGGAGVSLFDPHRKPFATIALRWREILASPVDVRAIEEDRNGVLWVGTFGDGLYAVDEEHERTARYGHDPADPQSLSDDVVLALEEGAGGDLWVGTPAGLNRLDPATGRFRRYLHDSRDGSAMGDPVALSLLEDRERGVLWIGTSAGLEQLDLRTERFTRYEDPGPEANSHHVYSMRLDASADLWLARAHGLDRFDPETREFHHFTLVTEESGSQTAVWAIHAAADGSLWLGTSSGLLLFDPRSGEAVRKADPSGQPVGTVTGILEDGDNRLWLARTRGLSRFDPGTGEFRHFSAKETGRRLSFSGATLRDTTGRFLFGAADGLTAFDPTQIEESTYAPPVVLTDFEIANAAVAIGPGSVLRQSITRTSSLELHARDNVLSFELAALSYREPEQNRYAYRLEGFDREWNEVDSTRRRVTYTNLRPGDYVFRFKGSNNDGFWNQQGGALRLTIKPFWWQTSWFRAGGFLAAFLAIVAAHRARVAALRRRERQNRSVLESLASRIALLDREGRITAANSRWRESAGPGADYLSTLRGAAAEGDRNAEEALAGIEAVLRGSRTLFEAELSRAGPTSTEWHSMIVVPFQGEKGGAVVSYTDITDRKRAEEEAQKRRQELAHVARLATMGELTASIAHEVNQPLASIVTYANAGRRFLEHDSSKDEVRGVLHSIAEQGKRAGDIIRELRELMKKGRVELEPLEVNELVSAVLSLVRGDARAKGIAIRHSLAPGLPRIRGSRVELQQVVLNLMVNALDAMEEDGGPRRVTVRTWSEGSGDETAVQVAIADTGPPVPEETLQKMFQRFYTSKPTGLGMGLSICQTIVEAHDGRLWAERNRERGLTLRLSLKTSGSD